MPFKSKAQERFAFATNQPWAKQWAKETPSQKKLPEHKHPSGSKHQGTKKDN